MTRCGLMRCAGLRLKKGCGVIGEFLNYGIDENASPLMQIERNRGDERRIQDDAKRICAVRVFNAGPRICGAQRLSRTKVKPVDPVDDSILLCVSEFGEDRQREHLMAGLLRNRHLADAVT
jgi:hypothetical protein